VAALIVLHTAPRHKPETPGEVHTGIPRVLGSLEEGHGTACMACSERMGHRGQGTWQPPACVAYTPPGGRYEAVSADIPIVLVDHGDGTGPPSGVLPASVRGLHEQHSGWGFRRCCRHAVLGMTVIAAEEPAWTCAAAWGSMRRRHPPRGSTEASHVSRIGEARGCNGLCRILALGVTLRRSGTAARDAVAKIVTPVLSDIEAAGTRRPRVEDPATGARASHPPHAGTGHRTG
jgi:hypothetical protein